MEQPAVPASDEGFSVELPLFNGPFRLLAELILDQKVDVCDIPIATVTDRFLAYAADAQAWTLEEATWFVAACALLLELKVGRLTPRHKDPDEEDLLGVSPDLVYARSLELAAIRHAAADLAARLERAALSHPRQVGPPREFAHLYPDVMENVSAEDLARTAVAVLRPPPGLDLSHVTPIRFTVEQAIAMVERRLGETRDAPFRDLVAECEDRIEVVVSFLALLELYREGKVDLSQGDTFGEIHVRWQG